MEPDRPMRHQSLAHAALAVLTTSDPHDKARLTHQAAAAWRSGGIPLSAGALDVPDRPARPERPLLLAPRDMPKRRKAGSPASRVALLHALAHIELNAVDLAWDMVARFRDHAEDGAALPQGFFSDWVGVASDEARHFLLLSERLVSYGAAYGDLPAHDGLWQASQTTAHDLAARLAVVPMVLEARGLDVTPNMIVNLRTQGDEASASVLQTIHDEEIAHVAAGRRWFGWVCARRGLVPQAAWQRYVRACFKGDLKPPFNRPSRDRADLPYDWYAPLAAWQDA